LPVMPALIGASAPIVLPLTLEPKELGALVAVLSELVATRPETANNLAAYVAAAAACPLEVFGFRELTDYVPHLSLPTNVWRMFVNSMTSHRWDDVLLVDALCACAPSSQVEAVVLEYEEIGTRKSAQAVLSVNALGAGFGVPLDFERVSLECDDYDERLIVATCALLDVYRSHYASPAGGEPPPVVALAPQLGEYPQLRRAVAARVGEYGMLVEEGYVRERVVPGLSSRSRPGASLRALLADAPLGARAHRLKRSRCAPPDEFVVPFVLGAHPQLAVVRPAVALPRDEMRAHRYEARAIELGELLHRIQPPTVVRALRLDAVRHTNHALFRRHALLLSVLHALLTGRLAPRNLDPSTP
jgi:hypothetical protein